MPSLFVLVCIVLSLLAGDAIQLLPFILFGTYGSWLYLRYFQTRSESNLRGDPSDEFGFDTFFPEAVRCELLTRQQPNHCAAFCL